MFIDKENDSLVCNVRPSMMWLEATSRCNLKCIACPRTYLPFFIGKDLAEEVFQVVKKDFFPYLKSIRLQNFGEPMLAGCFENIFDEAIKNNIDIFFSTNGMFLTEKWIRKFLENGVRFAISLDGAREETLKKIRPGESLGKITDSIKCFNRLKDAEYKDSKSSIAIWCVAMRSNLDELPELIDLAGYLNIHSVEIRQLNLSIHPLSMGRESLKHHRKKANECFILLKRKAETLGIDLAVSLYDDKRSNPMDKKTNCASRFPRKCLALWERIVVRANGDITPCCGSGEIMGNIKKDDFWDIWNGPKYQNFRSRINTDFPPLDCRNCVQAYGINAGNPENTKSSESLMKRPVYFIEHMAKLLRYSCHYLKDYL
jgi:radical SAM protein with 4Fe4S-binding SPASM domain